MVVTGSTHAGVDLLRAHDDRPVDLPEGVALLQVVETDEGADFGAVAEHAAVGGDLERAHVVGDDPQFANVVFAQQAEGFERFGLAGGRVADHQQARRRRRFSARCGVIAPWYGIRPRFIITMLCSVSTIFLR